MSSIKNYKKDDLIVKEGEKAKNFFILVDGKVGIIRKNEMIAEFSKSGDIVGEMSFILNKPRTGTLKALTDCSLLTVEGELDDIIKQYPDISKKLIRTLAERLTKAAEHRS
jgi:CRP-like cAMP-binding protein